MCDQTVRLAPRRLRGAWMTSLLRLYRFDESNPGRFYDYRNKAAAGEARDHTTMKHWKLIEFDEERVGFWRITAKGKAFVNGEIAVPAVAWTYNDACLAWSEELVTFERISADAEARRAA